MIAGVDGGGPHQELLRRLVHWLMKEPELEEEALTAEISPDGEISIVRRTLADDVPPARVIDPEGNEAEIALDEVSPGRFVASTAAPLPGLYRVQTEAPDGRTLFALAASGEERNRELDAVTTTTVLVEPLAEATGGAVHVLRRQGEAVPGIRRVAEGRNTAGQNWIGFPRRRTVAIESVRIRPILSPWLGLFLMGGFALAAWLLEGKPWRRNR